MADAWLVGWPTEQGQVYVWGNGGCGRLGTGSAEHVMTPKLLVNAHNSSRPYSFKQVDCGDLHTLAVTGTPRTSSRV